MIRIQLPLVPPKAMSLNARNSRWNTSKVSKKYREQAKQAALAQLAQTPLTFSPPIRYDLNVYWGKGRLRCDDDGLMSMSKPVIDGVVDALGLSSDRLLHIGGLMQGRDADNVGWMEFVLMPDDRDHGNVVRRMGE